MSTGQLKELWDLVRENEKTIAILSTKLDANDATLRKLIDDNKAFSAILNKSIGARTVVCVVGEVVGSVMTWLLVWFTNRDGGG